MYPEDLEPPDPSDWPRRLTVVGYLVAAAVVILTLINGIHVPW